MSIAAGGCSGSYQQPLAPSLPAQSPAQPQRGPISPSEYARIVKNVKSTTVRLAPGGGSFRFPNYDGFSGLVHYAANNAPAGATLMVTNSGSDNLLGAPTPPTGKPILYLEASLGGSGVSDVKFQTQTKMMTVVSSSLQAGSYRIDVYSGSQQVESYSAGVPSNGKLTFQTPFSGLSIYSGMPLTIEVVFLPLDWDTFGYDLQRSGYNPVESTVGVTNVGSLEKVWSFNVDSSMVHEPVFAYGVSVNGEPTNVLYAGSAYGSTMYAINASTGAVLWEDPVPSSTYNCGGGSSQFSIGETPAIDRGKNLLYFNDGENEVYAVDLSTGKEAPGWPITIADYTPDHNFMHGGFTYNPANGLLYAVTGSTCDISPWYGRIVAINTVGSGPSLAGTFFTMSGNSMEGPSGGGIWGPGGASIDPSTNNVFIATGNADTTMGALQNASYAEQVIELSSTLGSILANDYPTNIPTVPGDDDFDFGATPLLFDPPGCPALVAAVNKSGVFELYDRASISNGPIQYIAMSVPTDAGDFVGVPAYDPVTGYVYVGLPTTEGIYQPGIAAFSMQSNCTLNPTPVWSAQFGPDGGPTGAQTPRSPISVANGVVYVANYTGDTEYAFNAATGQQLWMLSLPSWGNVGTVIADGMVFVGSAGGTITAYALPSQAKSLGKRVVRTARSVTPVYRSSPLTPWAAWKP
jgi:outer membrane protein assembly factor BamB